MHLSSSLLFWNEVDSAPTIRKLGDTIVRVHGKVCYVDPYKPSVSGCDDQKTTQIFLIDPGLSEQSGMGITSKYGRTSYQLYEW